MLHDRKPHRVTRTVVSGDPVGTENAFEFTADALDRRGGTLVTCVRMKADTKRPPDLEGMCEHEKFSLRVDCGPDCRARKPGVADFATVDDLAAVALIILRPRPSLQVPETR